MVTVVVQLLYSAVLALLIVFSSYDEKNLWGKRWLMVISAVLFLTAGIAVFELLSNSGRMLWLLAGPVVGIISPFIWRLFRVKKRDSGFHKLLRVFLGVFAFFAVFAAFLFAFVF